MNKKRKIKAHDILSDEKFTAEYLSDKTEKIEESGEKEIRIARIIYDFLSSRRKTSWDAEKAQTKKRIKLSVQKHNRNKNLTRWAVAASILVVVFSVWFLQNNMDKETGITDFAQLLKDTRPDSVTNLILQDGRKVLITQEESQIFYDEKGENIIIDSAQRISQEVVQEKPVFNTLIVPYGKRTKLILSDGSKVWLNSGSKLVYPAVNTAVKREVYIEGEAVFEVTHSEQRPFFVITKDFEIKVLGTVFNVSAYPDDQVSSAVLAQGSIEINSKEKSLFQKEKLTILPGTMAVFDPAEKTFQQKQVETEDYLSWRDGYFNLKSEPLENIMKKLERYYNVGIVIQDASLGSETFSGRLDMLNTPEEVLKVIAETTPFSVRNENEKLIINLK
jgi:transmembrane sensor